MIGMWIAPAIVAEAMPPDLSTTNVLLGVIAAVSVLEVLGVVALLLGGFILYRRLLRVISSLEERQVAPVAARVNGILDDVKGLTATVKAEADRVDRVFGWCLDLMGRLRRDQQGGTDSR